MNWVYYILLLISLLAGLLVNLVGLPGLWVMVIAAILYAMLTGLGAFIGWGTLVTILALAGLAEIAEFIAGSAGAKAAGGSRRAMIGATVGGLLGGIFLTFLIPIPIVGSIIGALAGSFAGAAFAEFTTEDGHHRSLRVGIGAMKGRLIGLVVKSGFGVAILVVAMTMGFPVQFFSQTPPLVPSPTITMSQPTTPTTTPASQPTSVPTSNP